MIQRKKKTLLNSKKKQGTKKTLLADFNYEHIWKNPTRHWHLNLKMVQKRMS